MGATIKLPHAAKERMDRAGELPICVEVPIEQVQLSITALIHQFLAFNHNETEETEMNEDTTNEEHVHDHQYLTIEEVQDIQMEEMEEEDSISIIEQQFIEHPTINEQQLFNFI